MLAVSLLFAFQSVGDPQRNFAVGERDAFLMLPPEAVCGAHVGEALWTADGTALVAQRLIDGQTATDFAHALGARPSSGTKTPPPGRVEIVVWTVSSRSAKSVYAVSRATHELHDLAALPRSDRIVYRSFQRLPATATNPEQVAYGVSMLSARGGPPIRLAETIVQAGAGPANLDYALAPNRSLGVVSRPATSGEGYQVRLFGPNGPSGTWLPTTLPEPVAFDAQGQPGYRVIVQSGTKRSARFQRIDPATGRPGAVVDLPSEPPASPGGENALPPAKPVEEPLLLPVAVSSLAPRPAPEAPSVLLRVRGGKPEEMGVVTTDGARPLLSPTLNAIAYVHQETLMVRSLVRAPRSAFEQARDAALRAVAISNAKQAALAALMFAADHDDQFPSRDEDVIGKLDPYLKNRTILNGFTYLLRGGKQTDIEDPATAELGYVSGPGGRAVAYVDGHVRWVPDP